MVLKVKRASKRAELPSYAHNGDACFDLKVLIDNTENIPMIYRKGMDGSYHFDNVGSGMSDDYEARLVCMGENRYVLIKPGQSLLFHTGLKFETEMGYAMKMHARSSTGVKKNLILSNCTGIIDTAQYRGELLIGLTNVGSKEQMVVDGERIAQAEIQKVLDVDIVEVDELSDTERGEGGIGSTGGH